jgi:hypothetical protein
MTTKLRTRFKRDERIAIGEILAATQVLGESERNKPDQRLRLLIALMLEVAAAIVRGERKPRCASDEDVQQFARDWRAEERATFHPQAPRVQ